jgi:hypothetical protein
MATHRSNQVAPPLQVIRQYQANVDAREHRPREDYVINATPFIEMGRAVVDALGRVN